MNPSARDIPGVWQVELTNACPYRCLGCPRPRMTRPVGTMSRQVFEACLDAAQRADQRQLRPMGLSHFGESLLHPRILDFVRLASSRDVPTLLACNPGSMADGQAEGLLEAGLARVVFSLDGLDDSTLQHLRGPQANAALSERRIEQFLEARESLGAPCEVWVQMIAYEHNLPQRERFLQRWDQQGVRAFIKKFDAWTLPELAPLGDAHAEVRCRFPLDYLTVLWDGRVVPCCHDHDGVAAMGSILDGAQEVWRGERYSRFRERFVRGPPDLPMLCRRCCWRPRAANP